MSLFVVRNVYRKSPRLAEVRQAHREFLWTLVGDKGLRAAGPLPEADPPGGVLIFEAASPDEIATMLAADPLEDAGLVVEQTIIRWQPVVGDVLLG